jgi:hypothetical protein
MSDAVLDLDEVPAEPPPPDDRTASADSRGRWRLVALGVLVAFWIAPWSQVQGERGTVHEERWSSRVGVLGFLALTALWGLGATTIAASTRRGLRIGAAFTDAAVAAVATGFLLLGHEWIPGGDVREAWIPIFGPLAFLALLDATLLLASSEAPEVTVIRAGAALVAAAALYVHLSWLMAGVALWLGLSPLLLRAARPLAVRRTVEGMLLAGSVVALVAPTVHRAIFGAVVPVEEGVTTVYGWYVTALVVAGLSVAGLVRPEGPAVRASGA